MSDKETLTTMLTGASDKKAHPVGISHEIHAPNPGEEEVVISPGIVFIFDSDGGLKRLEMRI